MKPTMTNINEASIMMTTSYMSNTSTAYEDNKDVILLLSTDQLMTLLMIAAVTNRQEIQEHFTLSLPNDVKP